MPPTSPSHVEQTSLPRILVRVKGAVKYYAYVNGYIAGPKIRVANVNVTPIYYLSLVAMRGQGTTLDGIWSALTANNVYDVCLDGVGTVVLAHRGLESQLGYKIHWNYTQTELPNQDLHRVIESNMLTMYDPLKGAAPTKVSRTPKKKIQGSTATKKTLGVLEERQNREMHPLFLLLVPGNIVPERHDESDEAYRILCESRTTTFLSESYFAFLDLRAPWAMALEWSDYLWQRGVTRSENVKLTVWCTPSQTPILREAWLCKPNIALLHTDLAQALCEGRISNLETVERTLALV